MIDAPDSGAAAGEFHGKILQRRAQVVGSPVLRLFEVDFHQMAVGIPEAVGTSAAEIAFPPTEAEAGPFDRGGATCKRRWAHCTPGYAADTRCFPFGELQGACRVVAIPAEVHRLPGAMHDLHAEHVAEIPEAPVGLRSEQLDASQMCDVLNSFRPVRHGLSRVV